MVDNLIIVSGGKFGREVYSWARQIISHGGPFAIKGFLDDRAGILDNYLYAPVLSSVASYEPEVGDRFVVAVGDPNVRMKITRQIAAKGGAFVTLVHPTAVLGMNVTYGVGCVISPFVQLSCDMTIGNHVCIGSMTSCAHDVIIGDWCQISGHCGVNGNAVLEEGAFLGSHSVILPGARVGAWSYVGAGSVVLRRVQTRTKVFGNPATVIASAPIADDFLNQDLDP